MVTIILIALAAVFKAVADTLDDHFDTSVFKNKNPAVWDANYSEVQEWWITGYKPDPWHIANTLMIVCFILAAIFNDWGGKIQWWVQLIGFGVEYNVVFGLFYTHILRRK